VSAIDRLPEAGAGGRFEFTDLQKELIYKNPKTAEFVFYETIFNNSNCTIVPLKTLDADSFQKITDAADIIY
jgi:hypothetical protein